LLFSTARDGEVARHAIRCIRSAGGAIMKQATQRSTAAGSGKSKKTAAAKTPPPRKGKEPSLEDKDDFEDGNDEDDTSQE
jgi:hypothetical protein